MFVIRKSQFAQALVAVLLLRIIARLVFIWMHLYQLYLLAPLSLSAGNDLYAALFLCACTLLRCCSQSVTWKVSIACNLPGALCP